MGTFLVERYWPGVTVEAAAEVARRTRQTAEAMSAAGVQVSCVSSAVVIEDESVYTVFEAPNAQAVREASRRADAPVHRITRCVEVLAPSGGSSA